MTVRELVEKLKTMPQDAPVIYSIYSEAQLLPEDEPTLVEDAIERHGSYMKYNPKWWDHEKDGEPKLITVCWFPGN